MSKAIENLNRLLNPPPSSLSRLDFLKLSMAAGGALALLLLDHKAASAITEADLEGLVIDPAVEGVMLANKGDILPLVEKPKRPELPGLASTFYFRGGADEMGILDQLLAVAQYKIGIIGARSSVQPQQTLHNIFTRWPSTQIPTVLSFDTQRDLSIIQDKTHAHWFKPLDQAGQGGVALEFFRVFPEMFGGLDEVHWMMPDPSINSSLWTILRGVNSLYPAETPGKDPVLTVVFDGEEGVLPPEARGENINQKITVLLSDYTKWLGLKKKYQRPITARDTADWFENKISYRELPHIAAELARVQGWSGATVGHLTAAQMEGADPIPQDLTALLDGRDAVKLLKSVDSDHIALENTSKYQTTVHPVLFVCDSKNDERRRQKMNAIPLLLLLLGAAGARYVVKRMQAEKVLVAG